MARRAAGWGSDGEHCTRNARPPGPQNKLAHLGSRGHSADGCTLRTRRWGPDQRAFVGAHHCSLAAHSDGDGRNRIKPLASLAPSVAGASGCLFCSLAREEWHLWAMAGRPQGESRGNESICRRFCASFLVCGCVSFCGNKSWGPSLETGWPPLTPDSMCVMV